MPVNGMNVGKDYAFVFYDGTQQITIPLGDVQSIKKTKMKHDIVSRPYNGDPRFGFIPDGYRFAFSIVRTDRGLEDYMLATDTNFDNGGVSQAGYLQETIHENDGTTTRNQYPGFVFHVNDEGDVSREANVKMQAEGMASRKTRLA